MYLGPHRLERYGIGFYRRKKRVEVANIVCDASFGTRQDILITLLNGPFGMNSANVASTSSTGDGGGSLAE